jgi:hypothetical protein
MINPDYTYVINEVTDIIRNNQELKDRIDKLLQLDYTVIAKAENYCWNYSTGDRKWTNVGSSKEGAAYYDTIPIYLTDEWTEETIPCALYIQVSRTNGRYPNVTYWNRTYYVVVSDIELKQRLRKLKLRKLS